MLDEVVIFHTNDLYSHLENWPKIRRYLLQKRQQYESEGKTVFIVDLGDFIDRWHSLTEATNGTANVQLMNDIHYDAVTIGNNEGVGQSKQQLNQLYDSANFDILVGNLVDSTQGRPPIWAKRSKVIHTKSGNRICFIALTAPFPLTYEPNGWQILSVKETLPRLIQEVRPSCDGLILMSHLGIIDDKKIAHEYPEIDVILGAHTHHLFKFGKKINHVQLAAAGKHGYYIGEVHLNFIDQQLEQVSARVKATSELPAILEDVVEISEYMKNGHQQLSEREVADLPFPLSKKVGSENSFVSVALDALKKLGVQRLLF